MVPVITQYLQLLFAVLALVLGVALRTRYRQAGRFCVAGGVVLLLAAAFQILWLNVVYGVFGASSVQRTIAGAFAVEFVEAVLEGAGWILLVLAAFADRGVSQERGR
ncbi:MAG: hypothetical protein J2P38_10080 [Candidatus Dormibacteraeota bacterium]|nr:hypothetical protein [Candidatus Dormibacteraeota bacterium]